MAVYRNKMRQSDHPSKAEQNNLLKLCAQLSSEAITDVENNLFDESSEMNTFVCQIIALIKAFEMKTNSDPSSNPSLTESMVKKLSCLTA